MPIYSKTAIILDRLNEALRATGAPFGGASPRPAQQGQTVHFTENGIGYFVELHIPASATPAQRQQLANVLSSFNFAVRRTRSRADLLAAVQALTNAQRSLLIAAVITDFLIDEPSYVRKLGINLEGDETDPTP